MLIGGFQEFSLIDYPNKICAIVFTQGCNFRCPYCHNPELIDTKRCAKGMEQERIFSFLERRKGKLDAVEVTGGEPTLQRDLLEFLKRIKEMGYLTKLDSNGTRPDIIAEAVKKGLVDYLAMDIKAPLEKYEETVRATVDTSKIAASMDVIMGSNLDYEFRTTVVKSQLTKDDIIEIVKLIKGAKLYVLQKFVPSKTLDEKFLNETSYDDEALEVLRQKVKEYVTVSVIR